MLNNWSQEARTMVSRSETSPPARLGSTGAGAESPRILGFGSEWRPAACGGRWRLGIRCGLGLNRRDRDGRIEKIEYSGYNC
eukprot:scaffold87554_cov32-Tisochrysis_lutea.AAC.1